VEGARKKRIIEMLDRGSPCLAIRRGKWGPKKKRGGGKLGQLGEQSPLRNPGPQSERHLSGGPYFQEGGRRDL